MNYEMMSYCGVSNNPINTPLGSAVDSEVVGHSSCQILFGQLGGQEVRGKRSICSHRAIQSCLLALQRIHQRPASTQRNSRSPRISVFSGLRGSFGISPRVKPMQYSRASIQETVSSTMSYNVVATDQLCRDNFIHWGIKIDFGVNINAELLQWDYFFKYSLRHGPRQVCGDHVV